MGSWRLVVGEDAAREVPLELGDDESREAPAVSALGDLGEERVPVGANGLVEDRPLRLAAAIGRGERPAGGAGLALVGLRVHCPLALDHAAGSIHKTGQKQEPGPSEWPGRSLVWLTGYRNATLTA